MTVSGDTIVVCANLEDSNATGVNGDQNNNSATDSGAAYVFVRNGTTWSQQAYLKPSNTGAGDWFGSSLALSGSTLVVSAQFEDSSTTGVNGNQSDESASDSGAAYVFVRNGSTWSQQAYLKASNTGTTDQFGWWLGVSGDTAVVSANLEDSIATGVNGDQSDNSATDSGAAYVFVRNGVTWSQQAYLKASNTGADDRFGMQAAASGDTVAISAFFEDSNATGVNGNQSDNGALNSGAAYVFVRNGSTWSQQAYFKASNTGADDRFGRSVALSGDTVVVGAPREDSNATGVNGNQSDNGALNSGAAYVFVRNGSTWSQQAYLKASNTGAGDTFGMELAISGDTVVVSAFFEDSSATGVNGDQSDNSAVDSGAAYIFTGVGIGPRLTLVPDASGGYFLRFNGVPDVTYRLQRAPSLTGAWDTIATPTAPASGLVEYSDTTPPIGQAFYRVALAPGPEAGNPAEKSKPSTQSNAVDAQYWMFDAGLAMGRVSTPAMSLRVDAAARISEVAPENVPCFTDQVLVSGPSLLGLTVADDGVIYYADYFEGTVGIFDLEESRLQPLRTGLNHPYAIEAFGTKIFFTEAGSDSGRYHDGSLSVFDTASQSWATIGDGLHYPRSLFITPTGDIYVLEGAGTSTVFGGNDRLIRFPPGSSDYEIVLPFIETPAAVVLDSRGRILVTSWGWVSPGDTGKLFAYTPGSNGPETLLTGLPAVWDMMIDHQDDIYLAGFGDDSGPMVGIGLVPNGARTFIPIKSGVQAWCLARDRSGNVFYSTGRSDRSVRVLKPCSTNQPPIADASATAPYMISAHNTAAVAILDGSRSSDRDNDSLQFSWLENGVLIATGAVATVSLPVGAHIITLEVDDGNAIATDTVRLEIVTPAEAIAPCLALVEQSHIERRHKRPLIVSLKKAIAAFGRLEDDSDRDDDDDDDDQNRRRGDGDNDDDDGAGVRDPLRNLRAGYHQLLIFQHKVQVQIGHRYPTEAAAFIQCVQNIIDALFVSQSFEHGCE